VQNNQKRKEVKAMARKGENIHKRKDGRWEARIAVEESGIKKYKSLYGKSYKETKAKLLYFYANRKKEEFSQTRAISGNASTIKTFSEVTSEWFSVNKMRQKASTQLKYHNMFDNHILPFFGDMPITDIDEVNASSFLAEKLANGALCQSSGVHTSLSGSYVRTMGTLISSVLMYAAMKGYRDILKTPISKPSEERKSISVMGKSDLAKINQLLQSDMSCTAVGIAIALNAGLRIGEVCALRWDDIDLEAKTIHVRHTVARVKNDAPDYKINGKTPKSKLIIDVPKTQSSRRDIPINSRLYGILANAKKALVSDYVVSNRKSFVSPRTFEYRYHKFLQKHGITDTNFHVLRHTFSTRCVEVAVDIKSLSEMLGHSKVSTTLGIYVHSSMELKRCQIEKLVSE